MKTKNINSHTTSIDNRPIGVFDSGLGGLTVVAALRRNLPYEDIIYLGDTARVPYGTKSVESILHFSCQDVEFLLSKGVKMILAACNTVSAVALPHLREKYPELVLYGVLESGVQAALASGARSIVVLGTRATIASDAYRRGIHAVNPAIFVRNIACPLFVPLAEEGIFTGPIVDELLQHYLGDLKNNPPEAVVLGCTHYPLLKTAIDKFFNHQVRLIDSAEAAAEFLRKQILEQDAGCLPGKYQESRYFVTDMPGQFEQSARRFLGENPDSVSRISLDD